MSINEGFLRGQEKIKELALINHQQAIEEYLKDPIKCTYCRTIIPYEKRYSSTREHRFCNSSCAAKYSNSKRTPKTEETKAKIRESLLKTRGSKDPSTFLRIGKAFCFTCKQPFSYPFYYVESLRNWRDPKTRYCSEECRKIQQSLRAKNNPRMNGNHNYQASWYDSPIAGRVWLESSWEVRLAKEFDIHNILWVRPKNTFSWTDSNNKEHKYYPDFYLKDFDLYIDPKNPHKALEDQQKIDFVRKRHSIKLLIISDPQNLTWKYVQEEIKNGATSRI